MATPNPQGTYLDESLQGSNPKFHFEKPTTAPPQGYRYVEIKDVFGGKRYVLDDITAPKIKGARRFNEGMTLVETLKTGFHGGKGLGLVTDASRAAGHGLGHVLQVGPDAATPKAAGAILGAVGRAVGPRSEKALRYGGNLLGSLMGGEAAYMAGQAALSDKYTIIGHDKARAEYTPEYRDEFGELHEAVGVKQETPGFFVPMLAELIYGPGGKSYEEKLQNQLAAAKKSPEYLKSRQAELDARLRESSSSGGSAPTGVPVSLTDVQTKRRESVSKKLYGNFAIPSGGFDQKTMEMIRDRFMNENSELSTGLISALDPDTNPDARQALAKLARGVADKTSDPGELWNELAKYAGKGKMPDTIVFPVMLKGDSARNVPRRMLVLNNEGGSVQAFTAGEGGKQIDLIDYNSSGSR